VPYRQVAAVASRLVGEPPSGQGCWRVVQEEGARIRTEEGELVAWSSGKERAGGRRHRRFRLLQKGCYATTATADSFGRGLAARGFSWGGLH
jgi:hypothetical protein